jgi:peptidoglycan/LPS O-acetylase OafA/YrhL
LPPGDEAMRHQDRSFRPDIEGLRAVAVALVALCHAHVQGLEGGYVGVDVFYVISGFLITSLLLRGVERMPRGAFLRNFYARRVRRLLPAASLTLVLTVFASYHYLGFLRGDEVARDGIWCSAFAANFHFALVGTNYLASQAPPSPLQHFWSLGVEEQFYLVWPSVLLLVVAVGRRVPLRIRLGVVLAAIFTASLIWSVLQTTTNPAWAYFSPLTRAWELAAGAIVAVALPLVSRVPAAIGTYAGWLGLLGILTSALLIKTSTPFPGIAALGPVLATSLAIVGGTTASSRGAEALLGTGPFQWLGKLSYSFYLWHWPVLIIASEYRGTELSVRRNLVLLLIALGFSVITFVLLEHPIRRWRFLRQRDVLTLVLGCALICVSVSASYWALSRHAGLF